MEKNFKAFQFFYTDFKVGVSNVGDSFCILTKSGISIYDDVDSFLDAFKEFIENVVQHKDNEWVIT